MMLQMVMDVLNQLGITQAIQLAAVALVAIFLFRYFLDK